MTIKKFWALPLLCAIICSCTKNDIQFGNTVDDSYTRLLEVDTVGINMSTFVLDSFATNSLSDLLFGRYNDSAFGKISAKPFVQLSAPADPGLESGAVYDSLAFVLRLNHYFYGDTTLGQTININELAAPIDYTYSSSLFNTSNVAENPVPLGSKYVTVNPGHTDSISIRLNDAKGLELFNKLKQASTDVQTTDAFLKYFRGVSIGFSSTDVSAIYGVKKKADSIFMRLYYHVTTPYPEKKWKDFAYYSGIDFNQIIADRSSSRLPYVFKKEISSDVLNHQGFTQASAGVLLKMTFPSLRNVMQIGPTVKLLNATLIMNVAPGSYDKKLKLPSTLGLYSTDATNIIGGLIYNSSGTSYTSEPVSDNIYSTNTYYSFDVTTYVNSLLNGSGTENNGFFLIENAPGTSGTINRAIFNDSKTTSNPSKLVLSLLTLKD